MFSACSEDKQGTKVAERGTGGHSIRLGKAFLVYFPETRTMNDAEWVRNAFTNQVASDSVPSSPLKET